MVAYLQSLQVRKPATLEKAWRSFIPVESFTRDPADPTPITESPEVGIRWGKPADFEFDLSDLKQRRKQGTVTEVPRYYFENEILDFTEIWRQFQLGKVNVLTADILPAYTPGMKWTDYLALVKGLNDMIDALNPKVELEELQSWMVDSGISWTRFDSNGDPVANVSVYYEFTVTDFYIPFLEYPRPTIGERGEHPGK